MRVKTADRYSPWFYPTNEELLEVNFSSIVSDFRSIVRGTLVPRTWTDISGTWTDREKVVTNTVLHRNPMPGVTRQKEGIVINPEELRAARELREARELIISTDEAKMMIRIFMTNGLSKEDATTKTIELMKEIQ